VAPNVPVSVQLDGPTQAQVGEQFEVRVNFSGAPGAQRMHAQLRIDPRSLKVLDAKVGSVLPASASAPRVQSGAAGAQVDLVGSKTAPLAGAGSLMVLRLQATAPSAASAVAAQVMVTAADGTPLKVPPPATLNVAVGAQQ
jgi:hypothetical protein